MLPGTMPIYCPVDHTENPDRANFCMECGRPLYERYGADDDIVICTECHRPIYVPYDEAEGTARGNTSAVSTSRSTTRTRGRNRTRPSTQPRRQMQWEYMDHKVIIDLPIPMPVDSDDVVKQTNDRVLAALQRLGREGWQAEHLTDWKSLRDVDRINTGTRQESGGGFLGLGTRDVYFYDSVTLRLKRLAPG